MDFTERVLWKLLREPGYGFNEHVTGWGLNATREPYLKFEFTSVEIEASGCSCSAEASAEVLVVGYTQAYYDAVASADDPRRVFVGRYHFSVSDDPNEFMRNFMEAAMELHEDEMDALKASECHARPNECDTCKTEAAA